MYCAAGTGIRQVWTGPGNEESELPVGLECHGEGYHLPSPEPIRSTGTDSKVTNMIILGLILLVVGFLTGISILWTLGIILLVVGVILALLGATGRAIGGRRHWY